MLSSPIASPFQIAARERRIRGRILWIYLLLTYFVTLATTFSYLHRIKYSTAFTYLFSGAVYLVYDLVYIVPVFILLFALNSLMAFRPFARFSSGHPGLSAGIIYGSAVVLTALVQILLFIDATIFRLYGFHINGFVWNLVTTKGGVESLGGGSATILSSTLICLGFIAVQGLLLAAILKVGQVREIIVSAFTRKTRIALACVVLVSASFEQVAYGVSHLRGYSPVIAATRAFPVYIPLTFRGLGTRLGLATTRDTSFKLNADAGRTRYPLNPITRSQDHPRYNIVWLVAESLRFDMLTPEIMPGTWAFAQKATQFTNHYSGGNGTRQGLFALFYGLYGSYWHSFLAERRGPILIDLLMQDGYQMQMYTGARFTYPEFDKTIFANVPSRLLHEAGISPGWRADRKNVAKALDFLDHRDSAKPFFLFMFFESPHARYYFPEENAIRKPYSPDMDYATLSLNDDFTPIKNRYINSCNHLDSQVRRVLDYLEAHNLLDSTIVLITGDHGEEFMEKGRWGHNSAFTDQQVRVPMVLKAPGKAAGEITHLTSHMDIPPTLMTLLGVTNPPEDYSFGYDLFGTTRREFTIAASWDEIGYIDDGNKAVFPLNVTGFAEARVTTKEDAEVKETAPFFEKNKTRMLAIFKDLTKFSQ